MAFAKCFFALTVCSSTPLTPVELFICNFCQQTVQKRDAHTFSKAIDLCIFGRPVVVSNLKEHMYGLVCKETVLLSQWESETWNLGHQKFNELIRVKIPLQEDSKADLSGISCSSE